MGLSDKNNYIVNTGIIKQVFKGIAKVVVITKTVKLRTLYENMAHS